MIAALPLSIFPMTLTTLMVPLEEGNFVRIMEISMAQDGGIGPME